MLLHTRLQYSVNITFICTEKLKIHVTDSIVIRTLLWWSGTEPTIFPNNACASSMSHEAKSYRSTRK